MDLYLMDAILKGKVPERGKVLDIGCGEGRNGIYFIQHGYEYVGVDQDASKVRILEYLTNSLPHSNASFLAEPMDKAFYGNEYDLILASRILHFANSSREFRIIVEKIAASLKPKGMLYLAMDSAIIESHVQKYEDGKYEFRDGRISFCLTEPIYKDLLAHFTELEEIKTVFYKNKRVQSFALLQKT